MKTTILLMLLIPLASFVPRALDAQEQDEHVAGTRAVGIFTLSDLLESVAHRNPRLAAVEAYAEAAAARVPEASTLPDPMLQMGVMNVGLPDLDAGMAGSMAPSIQLMQAVPFPGKLGLRGEIASADQGRAEAAGEEVWWETRAAAADLFYELYTLDRRTEVMRETLALLVDFQGVARSLYASGTGRQADVLRADVEVARMDGEIRRMEAMRKATAARLNGLQDLPASTGVASPVLDGLPSDVPPLDTLVGWALEGRPLLRQARLGVRQAEARSDLARKDIWPDLTLGLGYAHRDAGMGTERMGSAMIGFSLPVHASRRQGAAQEEALAITRMAEADLRGLEVQVDARITELLAELERSRTLVALYRHEVLPVARATVESALSSYRVGAVDFMTLVDAQMAVNRYEGDVHQLLAEYGRAVAGLESALGRPLPPSDQTLLAVVEPR